MEAWRQTDGRDVRLPVRDTGSHAEDGSPRTWWAARSAIGPFVTAILFLLAAYAVQSLLRDVSYEQVVAAFERLPPRSIVLSLVATAASFACLTGYDWSALRYVQTRVSFRVIALASFCAYALGNTAGFAILAAASVRYRIYSGVGLSTADIARLSVFCALAFGIGVSAAGGLAVAIHPNAFHAIFQFEPAVVRTFGITVLASIAGFVGLCFARRAPLRVFSRRIELPTGWTALGQIIISFADIVCAAAALFVLLPNGTGSFGSFLAVYSVALMAGVASHVPGGFGVFEAVMLIGLNLKIPHETLAAGLLAYRVIYNLLPLTLTAVLLVGGTIAKEYPGALAVAYARRVGDWGSRLVPSLMATLVFISGTMLLVSGATPVTDIRIGVLAELVPLPVLEASHFFGSVVAIVLMVLAFALYRRLSAAYWLIVTMLIGSVALTLVKGVNIGDALVLLLLLGILMPCRKEFYRPSSLIEQRLTVPWLLTLVAAVGGTAWLALFSFRNLRYAHDLWWQFAFEEQAPRALRAVLGVAVAVTTVAIYQLLRPSPPRVERPKPAELEQAVRIIQQQPHADANLALMGDKALLFSLDSACFIMFAIHRKSWIALGDPVGPRDHWSDLVWQFRELCDRHGGRAAFYQVRAQHLTLYLDAGLVPFKLGEEGRVPLGSFCLKGPTRSKLRYTLGRCEREGLSVELLRSGTASALMPELQEISDSWLHHRKAREKRFSLGAFSPAYIDLFDLALVREKGRLTAFATVMTTDRMSEATVDLMRHRPDVSPYTMEFLFLQLILHYQTAGFEYFSLGMAPLAGLEDHPLAPRWHRFGRWLYSHGEQFYKFQGLRNFKQKFDPVWEPRYLAVQQGTNPLLMATDVTALISGGLKGVIAR